MKNDGTSLTVTDKEKADTLGNFFSSVFVKESSCTWLMNDQEKPEITEKMDLKISEEVIVKKLKSLNPNKSPGPDSLHPRVLKEVCQSLSTPLYHIFNISLKTGRLPSAWKMASITAIYKNKGDKNCAGNYRPVSLTSIACKMLESIIRDSTLEFLTNNKLISDKQFGFLGGRSTVLQLLHVMEKWVNVMDQGGLVDVIYCDFRKAFDTVPHIRLFNVLKFYGFENPILSWIKDFLSQRKQKVIVNGEESELFDVISGVPQGSVLGPILFGLYPFFHDMKQLQHS